MGKTDIINKVLVIMKSGIPDHLLREEYKIMKLVIQRVTEASCRVDGTIVGSIKKGFLVLIGIGKDDTKEIADYFIKKMTGLRIFEDENGKTNLALKDVGGSLLLISQFTLYANCKNGNRPSFTEAAKPNIANELYEYFCDKCKERQIEVQKGLFGADMKVNLINDGPVTIILEE